MAGSSTTPEYGRSRMELATLMTLRLLGRLRPVGYHRIQDRSADAGGYHRYLLDQPPGSFVQRGGAARHGC